MTHDYFIPMRIIDWYLVKLAVKTKNGGNHTLLSAKNKSDQHLSEIGLINFTTVSNRRLVSFANLLKYLLR